MMKFRLKILLIGIIINIITILDEVNSGKVKQQIDEDCECGVSGEGVSNRIVGGVITVPHLFPWIVAIYFYQALHCGGTLINDRYVLTAGHCVNLINPDEVDVGIGLHDIKNLREGYIIPVEKIILHEDFLSDELHDVNDIALVKLAYPVKFSENIQPVCLPVKGSDYTGHLVKVSGWGRVTSAGGVSRYLRQANLRVLPYNLCKNLTFGRHLTESMMCAYNEDTDACQGDSGGPLLYKRPDEKYETVGVVSWGIGCAKRGKPGVYVKLTDYIYWIKFHTRDAIYCADR